MEGGQVGGRFGGEGDGVAAIVNVNVDTSIGTDAIGVAVRVGVGVGVVRVRVGRGGDGVRVGGGGVDDVAQADTPPVHRRHGAVELRQEGEKQGRGAGGDRIG